MGVRLAVKVGASALALVLAALPVMACTIPGAAMTAVERDCCKRMAQECGKTGMKQSHSCCQTTPVPDHPGNRGFWWHDPHYVEDSRNSCCTGS